MPALTISPSSLFILDPALISDLHKHCPKAPSRKPGDVQKGEEYCQRANIAPELLSTLWFLHSVLIIRTWLHFLKLSFLSHCLFSSYTLEVIFDDLVHCRIIFFMEFIFGVFFPVFNILVFLPSLFLDSSLNFSALLLFSSVPHTEKFQFLTFFLMKDFITLICLLCFIWVCSATLFPWHSQNNLHWLNMDYLVHMWTLR